jgi:hypothetical protein
MAGMVVLAPGHSSSSLRVAGCFNHEVWNVA